MYLKAAALSVPGMRKVSLREAGNGLWQNRQWVGRGQSSSRGRRPGEAARSTGWHKEAHQQLPWFPGESGEAAPSVVEWDGCWNP